MQIKDVEKIIGSLKSQPMKTVILVFLLFIFLAIYALINGFFGEMGKHILSIFPNIRTSTTPKETVVEKIIKNDGAIINQRTQGEQSPTIVSGGDVTIEYNSRKDKNKKE